MTKLCIKTRSVKTKQPLKNAETISLYIIWREFWPVFIESNLEADRIKIKKLKS